MVVDDGISVEMSPVAIPAPMPANAAPSNPTASRARGGRDRKR
jgi:hypothetical protein